MLGRVGNENVATIVPASHDDVMAEIVVAVERFSSSRFVGAR